jgi:hypothetical protein
MVSRAIWKTHTCEFFKDFEKLTGAWLSQIARETILLPVQIYSKLQQIQQNRNKTSSE